LHAWGAATASNHIWSPSIGLDDPTSLNPIASPEQTTTYAFSAVEGGCRGEVSITLTVLPVPDMSALSSSPSGCVPHTVSFLDASSSAQSYTWDFGDGSPVSNMQMPSHTYTLPGTYQVVLQGENPGGCRSIAAPIAITVADTLHPDFNVAAAGLAPTAFFPLVLELPDAVADFRNLTAGPAQEWHWDFGDGKHSDDIHPTHSYTEEGTYTITLRSLTAEGCVSTRTHGPVIVFEPQLFIPNAFTPNGDGTNDFFRIEYLGSQSYYLEIFDRWGAVVFTSRDKMAPWDGQTLKRAPAPEGVYVYHLEVGGKAYAGSFTLLR
jgi:gliding motility-associated-like protein